MSDALADAAKALGEQDGVKTAEIHIKLIKEVPDAVVIIHGYNRKDETVMKMCTPPLNEPYGAIPAPLFILDKIAEMAGGSHGSGDDDVLQLYEEAYTKAFWDQILNAAKDILNGKTH